MDFLISIFPGIAVVTGVFLFIMAIAQWKIWKDKKYERAKWALVFCLITSYLAFFQFVLQSRSFSVELSYALSSIALVMTAFGRDSYIRAISFFIAVPDRWLHPYLWINYTLGILAFLGLVAQVFTDFQPMFDLSSPKETGNYFSESFTYILGEPQPFGMIIISLYSIFDLAMAIYLVRRLIRDKGDSWFIRGLAFTIVAGMFENILLPFTQQLYFPIYTFANFFEAGRICFLSLREYVIELAQDKKLSKGKTRAPYENSQLNDERISELSEAIIKAFEVDHIYLDPLLKLERLARALGIPDYQVSQVLSHGLNTSFFEIVNKYRVQAVEKDLLDPKLRSVGILEIAFNKGFNSKSSFNSSFKRLTGMTPSQYRRSAPELKNKVSDC